MTEYFEFMTVSFVMANLLSELIKYLGVKLFKKIDSMVKSPLDLLVEETEELGLYDND